MLLKFIQKNLISVVLLFRGANRPLVLMTIAVVSSATALSGYCLLLSSKIAELQPNVEVLSANLSVLKQRSAELQHIISTLKASIEKCDSLLADSTNYWVEISVDVGVSAALIASILLCTKGIVFLFFRGDGGGGGGGGGNCSTFYEYHTNVKGELFNNMQELHIHIQKVLREYAQVNPEKYLEALDRLIQQCSDEVLHSADVLALWEQREGLHAITDSQLFPLLRRVFVDNYQAYVLQLEHMQRVLFTSPTYFTAKTFATMNDAYVQYVWYHDSIFALDALVNSAGPVVGL